MSADFEGIMCVTSGSLPFICFLSFFLNFPFFLYFFAPLFAKLDFAVSPDAFPCIIYEKKKKIKRKKKHLAYFSL